MSFDDVLHEMETKKRRDRQLPNQLYYLQHGTIEQVTELIKRNGALYEHCSPTSMAHRSLFKLALKDRTRCKLFRLAPPSLRNDKQLVEFAVLQHPALYRHAPLVFRKNKEFALRVMKEHSGIHLRSIFFSCSKKLQRDPDVLSIYLKRASITSILKIAPTVLENFAVLKIILERTNVLRRTIESFLNEIPKRFLADHDTALALVEANPEVFPVVPPELQSEQDIFFAACDAEFNALKYVPHFSKREAVLRYSGCLESAPELQTDRAVVFEAVSKNPAGYKFAAQSLKRDVGIASTALVAGLDVTLLVPELWENESFLLANFESFSESPMMAWQRFPLRLKTEKSVILKFALMKHYILNLLPVEIFDSWDWIKIVAAHRIIQIKMTIEHKFQMVDIFKMVVPLLKRSHTDVKAMNALVFAKPSRKPRQFKNVKELPTTMLREISSFLVPSNYEEMRRAIQHLEEYWHVPFIDLA